MLKIRRIFSLAISFFAGVILNTLWNMDSNYKVVIENSPLDHPYRIDLLPQGDYNKLIDLSNFTFNILNQPCKKNTNNVLLVLVHSAPLNNKTRDSIRNTWGQRVPEVEVLFFLGAVDSEEVQNELNKENEMYKDLIQGSFTDAYRNLTYKHVMLLKYVTYHCPQAKYVLKTDDDVFVNTPSVISYVKSHLIPIKAENFLFCAVRRNEVILRPEGHTKWAVTLEEYSGTMYPAYCEGWAIIYSPDAVFKLYTNAQKTPYFWIDDVHVTGTLAISTNITHVSSSHLTITEPKVKEFIDLRDKQKVLDFFLFGPMQMTVTNVNDLWNTLYGTSEFNCRQS